MGGGQVKRMVLRSRDRIDGQKRGHVDGDSLVGARSLVGDSLAHTDTHTHTHPTQTAVTVANRLHRIIAEHGLGGTKKGQTDRAGESDWTRSEGQQVGHTMLESVVTGKGRNERGLTYNQGETGRYGRYAAGGGGAEEGMHRGS